MRREKLPITGIPVGSIPPSVIVCGDPARAARIASELDERRQLSEKREYRCFTGTYNDLPVAVCSHGIGAAGAAIAFEELITAGGRYIIRVGTCGGVQEDISSGHLVLATAAVANIGYAREVVPPGYPAVADVDVSHALSLAAAESKLPLSAGYVLTRDSFYGGVGVVDVPDYSAMAEANVLAVEMECAALFIVSALRKAKAGAILAVDGNVLKSEGESMESYDPDNIEVQNAIGTAARIALNALTLLSNDSN